MISCREARKIDKEFKEQFKPRFRELYSQLTKLIESKVFKTYWF